MNGKLLHIIEQATTEQVALNVHAPIEVKPKIGSQLALPVVSVEKIFCRHKCYHIKNPRFVIDKIGDFKSPYYFFMLSMVKE